MNIINTGFFVILLSLLISSCNDNSVGEDPNENLLQLNGPIIIYNLVDESSIENRINNSNKDKILFNDNSIRSNVRISPDKKSIIYVKNASIHPWYGYYTDGIPAVTISADMGKTEKKLLSSDSLSIYFIDWINENKIAISSKENDLFYITIINTNGDVLERKVVSAIYKMYMLPGGEHLIAYNTDEFGVLNVTTNDFQVFNPEGEISVWQTPFYTGSAFIINLFDNGYRLLEFDLNTNSYKILSIKTPNVRLVYADENNWIYYNYVDKMLNLFRNGSAIRSVILSGYRCDIGLSLVNENEFYFIGESTTVDDEGIIVKINFSSNKAFILTHHGEDKFIIDPVFYNL